MYATIDTDRFRRRSIQELSDHIRETREQATEMFHPTRLRMVFRIVERSSLVLKKRRGHTFFELMAVKEFCAESKARQLTTLRRGMCENRPGPSNLDSIRVQDGLGGISMTDMPLFSVQSRKERPLADLLRPDSLYEMEGISSEFGWLRRMYDQKIVSNLLIHGHQASGKRR